MVVAGGRGSDAGMPAAPPGDEPDGLVAGSVPVPVPEIGGTGGVDGVEAAGGAAPWDAGPGDAGPGDVEPGDDGPVGVTGGDVGGGWVGEVDGVGVCAPAATTASETNAAALIIALRIVCISAK